MRKIVALLTILAALAGCGQPGNLPMLVVKSNTVKGLFYDDFGVQRFRPFEMVCYIDTSRHSPLNALDYTLQDSGLQFFDYVVLSGAYLAQDGKGYYLGFTDDLLRLLEKRYSHIAPLQRAGIKVLLGVQSQKYISLGHADEDQMIRVSGSIFGALQDFELDGVELFDSADPSVHPPYRVAAPFDPDIIPSEYDYIHIEKHDWNEERWLLEEWKRGGNILNDFPYTIRQMFDEETRDTVPVLWREAGYGKYAPNMVRSTAGIAFFIGSNSQITYSFNADSSVFQEKSAQRYSTPQYNSQGEPATWMPENQFGPLFVELDGAASGNIWYPEMKNADVPGAPRGAELMEFVRRFRDPPAGSGKRFNSYQALYFNALKPLSEMAGDPFYRNLFFKPATPPEDQLDFLTMEEEDWARSKAVSAEYVFSMVTRMLLGENVINANGNHQKDW